jgi:hypothetical protein
MAAKLKEKGQLKFKAELEMTDKPLLIKIFETYHDWFHALLFNCL